MIEFNWSESFGRYQANTTNCVYIEDRLLEPFNLQELVITLVFLRIIWINLLR